MYESFLDLFTLLSFVLIIAAIIRVERLVGYDQNTALCQRLECYAGPDRGARFPSG